MIVYSLLAADEYLGYARFVLPSERKGVRERLKTNVCFAVGAAKDGLAVGLAVMNVSDHDGKKYGFLHTVNVRPDYLRQGMGTQLVSIALVQARQLGCSAVSIAYGREYDWSPELEKILAGQGFVEKCASQVFNIQVNESDWASLSRWMNSLLRSGCDVLPRGFAMIPYKEMTQAIRDKIAAGRDQWFTQDLCPFWQAEKINQKISQILLKDDEPVGWLIICNAGADAVLYRNMVIKKEYRGLGLFVSMLYHGIAPVCESRTVTRALFNTDTKNTKMLSAIKKVLKPCSYTVKTQVTMEKSMV